MSKSEVPASVWFKAGHSNSGVGGKEESLILLDANSDCRLPGVSSAAFKKKKKIKRSSGQAYLQNQIILIYFSPFQCECQSDVAL